MSTTDERRLEVLGQPQVPPTRTAAEKLAAHRNLPALRELRPGASHQLLGWLLAAAENGNQAVAQELLGFVDSPLNADLFGDRPVPFRIVERDAAK